MLRCNPQALLPQFLPPLGLSKEMLQAEGKLIALISLEEIAILPRLY